MGVMASSMGDHSRSRLRSALDDLASGLRSALGLEPSYPELIEELLDGGDARRRAEGPRRAPLRKRSPSGQSPLALVK